MMWSRSRDPPVNLSLGYMQRAHLLAAWKWWSYPLLSSRLCIVQRGKTSRRLPFPWVTPRMYLFMCCLMLLAIKVELVGSKMQESCQQKQLTENHVSRWNVHLLHQGDLKQEQYYSSRRCRYQCLLWHTRLSFQRWFVQHFELSGELSHIINCASSNIPAVANIHNSSVVGAGLGKSRRFIRHGNIQGWSPSILSICKESLSW